MAVADTVVPMPNRENSSTPWYKRGRLWGWAPSARAQSGKKRHHGHAEQHASPDVRGAVTAPDGIVVGKIAGNQAHRRHHMLKGEAEGDQGRGHRQVHDQHPVQDVGQQHHQK